MSVINQALSDLEKRGATALQGDADIRAVPQRHKRHTSGLIAGGVVLGIVAAGLWWSEQKKIPPPPPRRRHRMYRLQSAQRRRRSSRLRGLSHSHPRRAMGKPPCWTCASVPS